MCGRYNITDDPATRLLLDILGVQIDSLPLINVAPTEDAPVVRTLEGERALSWMRWWLVPSWSSGPSQKYSMFNARAETMEKSRAFRGPFRRSRCIVPASSFLEWSTHTGEKEPYRIRGDGRALAFAGLWDCWERDGAHQESFAIVTTESDTRFRSWHNRMPVMLDDAGIATWLDPDAGSDALHALAMPVLRQPLRIAPLSRKVNNARNKDPVLLEPIGEEIRVGSVVAAGDAAQE